MNRSQVTCLVVLALAIIVVLVIAATGLVAIPVYSSGSRSACAVVTCFSG